MKILGRLLWLGLGLAIGTTAMLVAHRPASRPALAYTDHTEDYVMTTGQMQIGLGPGPNNVADGIWILDYRAGKLLGSIVDPNLGRVRSWDAVDLIQDFGIAPKQNVHFLMTTGTTIKGHTPLYLAEVNTGRMAVYGMMPAPNGLMMIRKFDFTTFRQPQINPEQ